MALYFNTITPDPMHHATPPSSLLTTASKFCPGVPCSQNKTQSNIFGRSWVDVRMNISANVRELFKAHQQEWLTIPAQVIHNLILSEPKRCLVVIDSRGLPPSPPLLICVFLSHKIPTDSTVSWTRSVTITSFDLNQLQNKIGWTWFFGEFLNIN